MDTGQILALVCGSWIIFILGFFTAAVLAAAKKGDIATEKLMQGKLQGDIVFNDSFEDNDDWEGWTPKEGGNDET